MSAPRFTLPPATRSPSTGSGRARNEGVTYPRTGSAPVLGAVSSACPKGRAFGRALFSRARQGYVGGGMTEARALTVRLEIFDPSADDIVKSAVREVLAKLERAGYVKANSVDMGPTGDRREN